MRFILLIVISVLLGLCLLLTDPVVAQRKPFGVFVGRIIDPNGNPIRGASVTVESADYTRAVKPNPAGYFGIELPVGVYKITVSKDGFATQQMTNVHIWSGSSVHHVFRLERSSTQPSIYSVRLSVGDA
jgi:hypothetical protein